MARAAAGMRDQVMAGVNKSVLVPQPAARMAALVDDVERYPESLPWCGKTELLFRDEHLFRATIHINYHGVRQSFTTENTKQAPQFMDIRLVEGPFRMLHGHWKFTDLGGVGCKIELAMQYDFSSRLLERLVGPVFGHITNTLVDAFVKRAQTLYG
jgi:ribosome-associated toxin RatA of RatAB toxin-antitoxin module